jgi:DNA-binding CsgD family transcriptional regulator
MGLSVLIETIVGMLACSTRSTRRGGASATDAMSESLTASERRVADLVARGWTNQEVADALSLRPKTVEWALTKVYRKLGVRSRTELVLELKSLPGRFPDAATRRSRAPSARGRRGGIA